MQAATSDWAEFPVLYSMTLLVIHFKYSSVYTSIANSLTILSPVFPTWQPQVQSLRLWVQLAICAYTLWLSQQPQMTSFQSGKIRSILPCSLSWVFESLPVQSKKKKNKTKNLKGNHSNFISIHSVVLQAQIEVPLSLSFSYAMSILYL